MADRLVRLDSIRAVEAIAEANGTPVVRGFAFASTTLPDATYFAEDGAR